MTQLSVVIVSYNTCDLLRDCVSALQKSMLSPEIIIVDNASTDGSANMIRAEFPAVTLLAQTGNTWFCGGNNIGIEAATGDYVLLLNPDTVVQPDTLEKLVAFMESNPDYAGVTAQLRYPDGSLQRTCSRIPTYAYLLLIHSPLRVLLRKWKRQLENHHWYADEHFGRDTARDIQVMPGSCLMMRRAELHMDDDLLLYFPEDTLAQQFADRKFRFITDTHIIHNEKSSTTSWNASRIYYRDMMIYTRKQHGWGAMLLLWTLSRPLYWGMWLKMKLGQS